MYHRLMLAATLVLLTSCGDNTSPNLSNLPSQTGSIFSGETGGDANTTAYAANPNQQASDANAAGGGTATSATTTGATTSTTSATTTGGTTASTTSTSGSGTTTSATTTGGTATNGTTTSGSSGTTTGGTATSGTTTSGSTTSGTTTSGSTTSSGGATTSGTTTGTAGGSTIPATTGGPGQTSYNSSATNSINGTVEGVTIPVASALFRDSTEGGEATLVVILSDQANLCTTLANGGHPSNSHQVRMVFYAGSAAWPPNGNYSLSSSASNYAKATFAFYDANGNQTLASGNASLTAGTGQMQLNDYGHGPNGDAQGTAQGLVGSQSDGMNITFNATWCAAIQ